MQEKQYTSYRFIIQGLWLFVIVLQYYLSFAVSPLMQEFINDFAIDYGRAGFLMTIVSIIGGISMFGTNIIIQKLGVKKGIICALLSFAAGDFISVVSPNYAVLMVGRALIGVGYGLSAAFNGALTVAWFPAKEQAFVNTLNAVVGTLGQTMAFGLTIPLFHLLGSWQNLFIAAGAITAVIFIAWCILGREPQTNEEPSSVNQDRPHQSSGIRQALAHKEIIMLIFSCVGLFMTYTAFSTYLPSFLAETKGMSLAQASGITSVMTIAGLIGSLAIGTLSGITGKTKLFMWSMMATMLLGVLGSFVSANTLFLTVCVFLLGFGCNAFIPVMSTYIMSLQGANPAMVAGAIALTIGTANISNLFTSIIFNTTLSLLGMSGAFITFGVILAISMVITMLLPSKAAE